MRKGMKEAMIALVLLTLVLSLALVVGCGNKEGEVKVSEKDGKVTVSGEEGDSTYEWSDKAPTEAQLGVPIYPGADYVAGSGGSGSVSSTEGEATVAGAEFTTTDSFSKVVDWYTSELGAPMMTTDTEATWMSGIESMQSGTGSGDLTTVVVTKEDGKVKIGISRLGGM